MENIYTLAMLSSIVVFTLTSSVTPGPNNIIILSSGLTFGYKKTIPHILGVVLGYPFMLILLGLGIGVVLEKFPIVLNILRYVGIAYLFWMAYKIVSNTSSYEVTENSNKKPFSFLQSALFQWVNPKAWIMGLTVISLFVTSSENSLIQILTIALIYALSIVIGTSLWAIGGVFLKRFLKDAKSVRFFNIILAVFLIVSVVPVMFE